MGTLTVCQPTFGDYIAQGEKKFDMTLSILTTNTTAYRLTLWDMGIDWNTFGDFDLFILLYKKIDPEISQMIFDGVDLTSFEVYEKELDGEKQLALFNDELQVEINQEVYFHFSQYLRKVFSVNPEEKITSDPILKKMYIEKDRRAAANAKKKAEKGTLQNYSILPLVSACVNHPGFKYDHKTILNITMGQFYDSVHRLQVFENSTALLHGMYGGFINGKNIPPDNYNFMRKI